MTISKPHMLSTAIRLAATYHENQTDKGGKPYILHPLKVMHKLKTDDIELMCIAVMHDLIEDTPVTANDLIGAGFTKRVVDGVVALTKVNGESYEVYKERVLTNYDAMLVKLEDLSHNMDPKRLKGVTQKDMHRTEKYLKFYNEITLQILREHS